MLKNHTSQEGVHVKEPHLIGGVHVKEPHLIGGVRRWPALGGGGGGGGEGGAFPPLGYGAPFPSPPPTKNDL